MKKSKKKYTKIILIALAAVIILVAALGLWLYSYPLTYSKNRIFQLLPLPAATVNGKGISMQDFILRYQLAQKLNTGQPDSGLRQDIYNQMVVDAETAQVAQSHDAFVTEKQIDTQYSLVAGQADLGSSKNFPALLQSYGLSENNYKQQVIEPVLLLQNLKVWFYSQSNLNQPEYSLANSLVQRIQNGEDMGALAVQYSQDQSQQSTQGDLGSLHINDILPELQETVDSMSVGDVKIIPSRYGLDIIRLQQKNQDLYHLQEIFINGEGFNTWLDSQTQDFKVKKLLGI